MTLKPDFAALTYLMVNQKFCGLFNCERQQTLSHFSWLCETRCITSPHLSEKGGGIRNLSAPVLCGRCGGTDDGACERDDGAFWCTSILGQQRVFSGYASEK